jgi:hypothetical protein
VAQAVTPAARVVYVDYDPVVLQARRRYNSLARETQQHRTQDEVTSFFDGLHLVEPGVVPVQQWRPDSDFAASAKSTMWGGVARR